MAFGNVVTDGAQLGAGSEGYIVRFNFASSEPRNFIQVKGFNSTANPNFTASQPTESTLEELYDMLDDATAPDIAWAQNGHFIDIFLKTATHPYSANTRVGVWFNENADNITSVDSTTETLDIPQESRTLAKYLVLEDMYRTIVKKEIPQKITSGIRSEMARLGLGETP